MPSINKKDVEAQAKGFQDRIKLFMEEYGKLREKYDIDFLSIPQFIPSGDKENSYKLIIQYQPADLKLAKLNESFIQKDV